MGVLLLQYLVLSIIVVVSSIRISSCVDELDKQTKMGGALIGGILLGFGLLFYGLGLMGDSLKDLLKVYKEDDRCVEACMIKNKNYTQDTALKSMEYLNLRDHYASILRQYDPMKIVDKIEWKLEPDTERHFIYVYTNLSVPTFYDTQMNKMMNAYFENLKTECNCIGIKSTDFQPLAYNWS